jgi:NADH-quinone oxidoreductase subunit D
VLKEVHGLLTRNRIFMERMVGVGAISREDAISFAFTGPMLRACGIPYDVRKMHPYLVYGQLDFDVPTESTCDCYARYLVRMEEMEQSMRIVEQCLAKMPQGPINVDHAGRIMQPPEMVDAAKMGKTRELKLVQLEPCPNLEGATRPRHRQVNAPARNVVLPPKEDTYGNIEGLMNHFMLIMDGWGIQPPAGEVYQAVEGANGELGFYVVSDGSDKPYRVRVRPPCFAFTAAIPTMIKGGMVADVIPTFGSINMIAGELDR